MSALDDLDTAFEIANGLLLSRGAIVQQVQGSSAAAAEAAGWRMSTQWMFTPPAAAMWPDSRFVGLCDGIGLTDYWRKRGVKPDFQHS
jgi:hypothetical protein